ncbi:MAG: MFS transporter [Thermogemmatispora sp.]|jgi:MFS family permease|uniref:MFS transporter n=1 Tax=Thermogemmatispora aurantia TaxID=2045279 RepID=A0A5J4K9J3_9CHLR|nr:MULTISPECIES: MFS transporter [Thermogemmatispora]MBE3567065.1 MFS transporter [Thermogemmatispora sp.]GER85264.1 MFS transporter [Thermogemmatispora aurantia]
MSSLTLKRAAFRFVLLIGILSFFADFTYEGARGILGPYLALLGAGAALIGVVTGLGELLGYGLRLVSGPLSDRTGQYWPVTIVGYVVQMVSVPLLAVAGSWPLAALLIILERAGKAIRNPPRDVMLSQAAHEMGYGWAFGFHEALDQFGALLGPLAVAAVLAWRGNYRLAFASLAVSAALTLLLLLLARLLYPRPHELAPAPQVATPQALPATYWVYLVGAVLVAAGFADFPLIAYHFARVSSVPSTLVPVFYAIAMGSSGLGSLLCGRLFDRLGMGILIPLTVLAALFAPLVFLGGFWLALLGVVVWGLGMGVHESLIPAAVALMVPGQRRASAYGIFTAGYGICWFLGSALIGLLYSVALPLAITFCLLAELLAIPFFIIASRQLRRAARPA